MTITADARNETLAELQLCQARQFGLMCRTARARSVLRQADTFWRRRVCRRAIKRAERAAYDESCAERIFIRTADRLGLGQAARVIATDGQAERAVALARLRAVDL